MFTKELKRQLKQIAVQLQKAEERIDLLEQKKEEDYNVVEKLAEIRTLALDKDEKELLEQLAEDTRFIRLTDKLILGLGADSTNARTALDIAQIRGGRLALLSLQKNSAQHKKKENGIDPRTWKPKTD